MIAPNIVLVTNHFCSKSFSCYKQWQLVLEVGGDDVGKRETEVDDIRRNGRQEEQNTDILLAGDDSPSEARIVDHDCDDGTRPE
jgi:hypothetical protein